MGESGVPMIAATDRRLAPDEFLRSGTSDPARLLTLWYLRKSAYWLAFTGSTIAHLTRRSDDAQVGLLDPEGLWRELWSPLAGLALAVVVRLVTGLGGLVLAYPLAREYEAPLSARTGLRSFIGKWLDRRHLTSALRNLRWTHHVRQAALQRLGSTGERVGRLDPVLDVVNIATAVVLGFVVVTGATV